MKISMFLAFALCLCTKGLAQLQLDQIMKGPGFVGALPEAPEWSVDGKLIYYWKKHPDSLQKTFYSYHMSKKQTVVLTKKEWQDRWVWTTGAGPLNYLRLHDENLQYLDSKTQQVKTYPLFTNAIWNLQVQNNAQTVVLDRKSVV